MNTIPTTLVHRVMMPEEPAAGRNPLLILIHGRGADEEDLLGLAPMFDPRLILLGIRAPLLFEGGGFTWYTLGGPVGQPDPVSFTESYRSLDQCVRDVVAGYPVDPSRVFLFGFSMGAVMSLALGLTQPRVFRGIVAHSGYVPEAAPLNIRWNSLEGPSFFIAHGVSDQVIPIAMARRARQLFDGSNARITYREYPMGHEINDESFADIREWMRNLLDNEPVTGKS